MTKKKPSLTISEDLAHVLTQSRRTQPTGPTIEKALAAVVRQMRVLGRRNRTISDYELHVADFARVVGKTHISELTADDLYEWLSSMDVGNQTKLTRLKCLKAFLGRCFDNGWIDAKFWQSINVKVDTPVKKGATDREVNLLLSLLDLTRFVELRDAAALLTMYQTGLRVGTVSELETKHVDLSEKMFRIDGRIIKNHEPIYLPMSDELARILGVLLRQNAIIRREHGATNEYVFITKQGTKIATSHTNNNIQKRLNKYAREYGLRNINPHALRRGFAKNLLDRNANIALISKALGHSDIAVTTRYLHLDIEEVAASLRRYL